MWGIESAGAQISDRHRAVGTNQSGEVSCGCRNGTTGRASRLSESTRRRVQEIEHILRRTNGQFRCINRADPTYISIIEESDPIDYGRGIP